MGDESSDISYDNIQESLKKHIEKTKAKSRYHNINALAAKKYENILNLTQVCIKALLSLTMLIMTVYTPEDSQSIAIVSGSFSFCSILVQKIQQNYMFLLLSYTHHTLADDFVALRYELISMLAEENYDIKDFKAVINKYLGICARGHIQSVK